MPEITRTECRCTDRYSAQATGDLVYLPHHRAWVFTELAPRSMSASARIGAFVDRRAFKHEDHDGEPYRFTVCVFCGHDLPRTQDVPAISDATGDPEE